VSIACWGPGGIALTNVAMQLGGPLLTVQVDPTPKVGSSPSGQTIIVASTEGHGDVRGSDSTIEQNSSGPRSR
jgi:hypothetical protein